LKTSHQ